MANLNEKQKVYVLAAIFGIAGLVFYYTLLLKPQFSGFIARNKDFMKIKDRVTKEEALIANEAGIRKQQEIFVKQAEYLKKRLPGQDQISSLLEDFSSVAEISGVNILRIRPIEEPVPLSKQKALASASSYAEFPILIEARAGYHALGTFVNKLESMDRFIKITDIDVIGIDNDPRHHNIKIRMITYVLQ